MFPLSLPFVADCVAASAANKAAAVMRAAAAAARGRSVPGILCLLLRLAGGRRQRGGEGDHVVIAPSSLWTWRRRLYFSALFEAFKGDS